MSERCNKKSETEVTYSQRLPPQKMKASFEHFIRLHVKHPRDAEIAEILDLFEEKSYAKGEYFKMAHVIAKEIGFLVEGSAKSVIVKDNGDEISGRLISHSHFVFDMISARTLEKSNLAFRFCEDSRMLVAPYAAIKDLLDSNLTLNILIREYTADRTVEMGKWLMLFLTGSAKDRYQFILDRNPKLLNKFPLRAIASMIGITPTQLSRIRKERG